MGTLRRSSATALGLAALLAAVSACGGGSSDGASGRRQRRRQGRRHAGLRHLGRPGEHGRRLRQRRRVAARRAPAVRDARDDQARWHRDRAAAGHEYEPSDGRQGLDLHAARGREVPRRHAFDAEAVCTNFDRWYNFTGVQQSASVSYYWQTVFGGFAKNEDPDAAGRACTRAATATDGTAVINLTSPSASFLSGLALRVVLDREPRRADEVRGRQGHRHRRGAPLRGHLRHPEPDRHRPVQARDLRAEQPPRPGPLRRLLGRQGQARQGHLQADRRRPGPPAGAASPARSRATTSSTRPTSTRCEAAGSRSLERPAFNVGYVGFNTAKPPFDNPKIRQAIAYALNRQALVTAKYPPGAEVAKQFMPPSLFGYADDVPTYDYDVGEGQGAHRRVRRREPDGRVLVPDRRQPAVHAGPEPRTSRPSRPTSTAAGFKVVPKSRAVEPGLPQRGRHRQGRHAPARLDRRLR